MISFGTFVAFSITAVLETSGGPRLYMFPGYYTYAAHIIKRDMSVDVAYDAAGAGRRRSITAACPFDLLDRCLTDLAQSKQRYPQNWRFTEEGLEACDTPGECFAPHLLGYITRPVIT
jgi:hypothetical protein